MDIAGKRVLITGAGSGIGRTVARQFAERGAAEIIIVDRLAESAGETVDIVRRHGASARAEAVDVADAAALESLFSDEQTGALDIVFNNAGIITGEPRFPDNSIARIQQVVAVNLTAVLIGTQFAAHNMRRNSRRGAIINTASNVAISGGRNDPVYVGTKAGVLMFTRSCHDLAEQHGIRVNAVLPSITDTPMLKATGGGGTPAKWQQEAMSKVRISRPEEIGNAVFRLVEDESRYCDFELVENLKS